MKPIKLRVYDKNKSFNKISYANIEYFDDMLGFRFEHFESEPEDLVFMQYTGCEDRKGQGIYEGDIIKEHTTEDEYLLAEVIYTKGCFMGKEPGHDPGYPIYDFSGGEVIGNVYENPELLGGNMCKNCKYYESKEDKSFLEDQLGEKMKKTITVQAIWEFEVDADDLNPEYVDTNGLAVDLTKIELEDLLNKKELVADDFEFAIINKK